MMRVVYLPETTSTNSWLKENGSSGDMVVWTGYQTAGRGQGSHVWESERGKNLLFSILVHPAQLPVIRKFVLAEAHALALLDALGDYTDGLSVKWPNDLYWHDRKLSGTLIETSLKGKGIRDFIIGTGINVNQLVFRSDAPNPVSLRQILGHEVPLEEVLEKVIAAFDRYHLQIEEGSFAAVSSAYHASLYRREGWFPYRDRTGEFRARIVCVEDNGLLVLADETGRERRYDVKEVSYVL